MSLLEAVIGLVAVGTLTYAVIRFMASSSESLQYLSLKGQAEDIRNTLRIEMDCDKTLADIGLTCNGVTTPKTAFVSLLRQNGSVLIPKYQSNTPETGRFSLRASCTDTGTTYQMTVEAKQNKPLSSSKGLTSTLMPTWEDFFKGVPLVCKKKKNDLTLNAGYCLKRATNELCPSGYAAFGFTDPYQSHTSKVLDTYSYCCQVPSDLLTNTHTFVYTTCPADSVVTGGTTSKGEGVATCETAKAECTMRCTRINTVRYKLGPQLKGDFWTDATCPCATGGGSAVWRDRNTLPLAMRFGTGRISLTAEGPNQYLQNFDPSACIPTGMVQTGGIMVKKLTKQCGDYYGVQILYTGATAGDPVNMPVQLLPTCFGNAVRIVQGQERYTNFTCQ